MTIGNSDKTIGKHASSSLPYSFDGAAAAAAAGVSATNTAGTTLNRTASPTLYRLLLTFGRQIWLLNFTGRLAVKRTSLPVAIVVFILRTEQA